MTRTHTHTQPTRRDIAAGRVYLVNEEFSFSLFWKWAPWKISHLYRGQIRLVFGPTLPGHGMELHT